MEDRRSTKVRQDASDRYPTNRPQSLPELPDTHDLPCSPYGLRAIEGNAEPRNTLEENRERGANHVEGTIRTPAQSTEDRNARRTLRSKLPIPKWQSAGPGADTTRGAARIQTQGTELDDADGAERQRHLELLRALLEDETGDAIVAFRMQPVLLHEEGRPLASVAFSAGAVVDVSRGPSPQRFKLDRVFGPGSADKEVCEFFGPVIEHGSEARACIVAFGA